MLGRRAIIVYMTTVPLAEARAQLSKLVDDAVRTHERIEVTKNGRRAAVIMSADDYDSLMETLDILSDAEAMAEIRQADTDVAAGRVSTLDEVEAEMRSLGRLPE
jgi:antitoxin YefM